MRNYIDIVSAISLFSTSCCIDESKDYIFTASSHLAFDLADLGANFSYYEQDEDYKMLDGIIESIEWMTYGIFERSTRYDVNEGGMSDYFEVAKNEWSDDEE